MFIGVCFRFRRRTLRKNELVAPLLYLRNAGLFVISVTFVFPESFKMFLSYFSVYFLEVSSTHISRNQGPTPNTCALRLAVDAGRYRCLVLSKHESLLSPIVLRKEWTDVSVYCERHETKID